MSVDGKLSETTIKEVQQALGNAAKNYEDGDSSGVLAVAEAISAKGATLRKKLNPEESGHVLNLHDIINITQLTGDPTAALVLGRFGEFLGGKTEKPLSMYELEHRISMTVYEVIRDIHKIADDSIVSDNERPDVLSIEAKLIKLGRQIVTSLPVGRVDKS